MEQANPHHNTDDALATISASGAAAICYKTIASNAIAYLRYYIKFTSLALASAGERVELGGLNSGGWTYAASPALLKPAAAIIWGLWTQENGVSAGYNGTHTPVVDTWYCLEVLRDVTNDLQKLWVDGVLEVDATRAITTNTARAYVGLGYNSEANINVAAYDCVVVDTSYIGPEAAGGPTVKKGSCVPAMTALLSKFSALRQPREPRFQPRTFPKFTPRALI